MKFTGSIFIVLIFLFPQIKAQVYETDSIYFPSDPLLEKYLKDNALPSATVKGFMQMAAKEEFGGLRVSIEKGKDAALVRPVNGKITESVELRRVGKTLYRRVSSSGTRFEELDYSDGHVVYTFGDYRQLVEHEKSTETFKKLKAKYPDKFPANRISLQLIPGEGGAVESFSKTFKVTDVDLKVNEDVSEFGKEHVPMFSAYSEGYEDMMDDIYLGTTYEIEINGNRAQINTRGNGSSSSFGGRLNKIEEGVYRLEVLKSYYDLHIDGIPGEDFSVDKIVYSYFISPEEEYQKIPEYKALQEKYGKKLPYNTVVQEVKEVE